MTSLAVCAIVKNEGHYIYEWLLYHYVVGVRRFFIYDNNSNDNTVSEIERVPFSDLITVLRWPQIPGQLSAYNDAIERFRDQADWCAFIDCDEFLTPQAEFSVVEILDRFSPDCCGLYVHWLMFGSSGLAGWEPKFVTERFLRRGQNSFSPNTIGKCIVKMKEATRASNGHIIQCSGPLINTAHQEIDQSGPGIHNNSSHRYIALNHYFTKSREEWRQRRALGRVSQPAGQHLRTEADFDSHDKNDIEDTKAWDIFRNNVPRTFGLQVERV